jgi:hypothetical protein
MKNRHEALNWYDMGFIHMNNRWISIKHDSFSEKIIFEVSEFDEIE